MISSLQNRILSPKLNTEKQNATILIQQPNHKAFRIHLENLLDF